MVFERRPYPVLAVVLTACLVCLSVWRLSGCPGPPPCYLPSTSPSYYQLIVPQNVSTTPPPYPLQTLPPNDSGTLIDLHNFTFHINSAVCTNDSSPLLLVLVHSAPNNSVNRRHIRDTWGHDLDVVFFLGETGPAELQVAIDRESTRYGDLVQGAFLDSYRNLTYKHVMTLKWAAYHCPRAKYLLKTDDDVFVNTPLLTEILQTEMSPLGARRLIMCDLLMSIMAKRTYRSKWRVTPTEYPGRWYPPYCPGWAVLYSPDVAFLLYREAQKSRYFWIDDVHVFGTLVEQANLTQTPLGSLAVLSDPTDEMLNSGVPRNDFLFALAAPQNFHALWQMVNSAHLSSH